MDLHKKRLGEGNNDSSITDDVTCESVIDNETKDCNKIPFTVLNTNACSLCPKISSLIDCFSQMDASVGIVTETWLTEGEGRGNRGSSPGYRAEHDLL